MFGEVGHPKLVRSVSLEVAVHQIDGGFAVDQIWSASSTLREPADGQLGHDRLDHLLVDALPVGVVELGFDAPPPVGPS